MRVKQLLSLKKNQQVNWLKENIENFLSKAQSGDDLGYIIPFSETDLEEYIKDPEDYGTGNMIQSVDKTVSDSRVEEINSGSKISKREKNSLEEAHINQKSSESFITFNGFQVLLEDNEVYVCFSGQLTPHGSYFPNFFKLFKTKKDAIMFLNTYKYYTEGTGPLWKW